MIDSCHQIGSAMSRSCKLFGGEKWQLSGPVGSLVASCSSSPFISLLCPRKLSDSVWVRGDVAWGQSRLVERRRWTCTWSDRGGRVTWHFLSSLCSFARGHAELLGCFCLKTEGTNVPACPQWETRALMRWWSSVSARREVSERGKVVPTSKERSAPRSSETNL